MALCVVLPFAFHSIPDGGSIFSPMHIPVLLCGIICGWQYGLVCGIAGPFLSSIITQMPSMGYLPPMAVELAVYGLACGLLMRFIRTKKYIADLYISLAVSMLCGRVVAGIAKALIFMPGGFTVQMWAASYFVTAWPGIVLQLIIVPAIVMALKKAKLVSAKYKENEFAHYLRQQYRLHPSMQAQDAVKMCYQAAYGADHLLSDTAAAERYLADEFARTEAGETPLYEEISAEICRVNLAAWKAAGLPCKWLFNMFAASVRVKRGSNEQFFDYVDTAKCVLPGLDWSTYEITGEPVHHSDTYRAAEKPAYRIIDKRFVRLIPILGRINSATRVIVLDGRAASGKSTAAENLSLILGAPVVHMDDFFLPPQLRSEERMHEAGGNVHYERFAEEVLPHLSDSAEFSYRIFDCGKMELDGSRHVSASDIRIVEGAYSMHPAFGDYADIKVFFDVAPEEQMRRITVRNGSQMAEMFEKRWIPLEEEYYKAYKIKEKADIVIGHR